MSVCSGIDAATVAWHPLGWEALAFSEIEPFPCAVLAHHYPGTPNLGDLTKWREWPESLLVEVDLLVGGTPCQSFSVAGLRRGLEDDRGNLMLQFLELANAVDDLRRAAGRAPAWVLWENVPGVLSDGTNALGALLGGLVGSHAAIDPGGRWRRAGVADGPRRRAAWRCLDAQHFGLAQRRDRLFVLSRGGAGDWSAPDALLPIVQGSEWHPAPCREARERVAQPLSSCPASGSGYQNDADYGVKHGLDDQRVDNNALLFVAHTLRAEGHDASEDGTGRGTPSVPHAFDARQSDVCQYGNRAGALDADGHSQAVVYDTTQVCHPENRSNPQPGAPCHALAAGQYAPLIVPAVRRFTPRECERLQGFPDDYTRIPGRGQPAADGPRYRALGNSMAVPVIRWIGGQIDRIDSCR